MGRRENSNHSKRKGNILLVYYSKGTERSEGDGGEVSCRLDQIRQLNSLDP